MSPFSLFPWIVGKEELKGRWRRRHFFLLSWAEARATSFQPFLFPFKTMPAYLLWNEVGGKGEDGGHRRCCCYTPLCFVTPHSPTCLVNPFLAFLLGGPRDGQRPTFVQKRSRRPPALCLLHATRNRNGERAKDETEHSLQSAMSYFLSPPYLSWKELMTSKISFWVQATH